MGTRADFDGNGKFAKGNQLARGNGHPQLKRLNELRAMFFECITQEKMIAVEAEMYRLAVEAKDERVRLAAQVEWLNRVLGKSEQNINVQSENRTLNANVNISQEEQQVLEAIIAKNAIPTTAAPLQIQPNSD